MFSESLIDPFSLISVSDCLVVVGGMKDIRCIKILHHQSMNKLLWKTYGGGQPNLESSLKNKPVIVKLKVVVKFLFTSCVMYASRLPVATDQNIVLD